MGFGLITNIDHWWGKMLCLEIIHTLTYLKKKKNIHTLNYKWRFDH